jgi:hypothetical protein
LAMMPIILRVISSLRFTKVIRCRMYALATFVEDHFRSYAASFAN